MGTVKLVLPLASLFIEFQQHKINLQLLGVIKIVVTT